MIGYSHILIWIIPIVQSIATLFSQEATDGGVSSLLFILQPKQNCLETIADLKGPNKNMAALWLRATFHHAGTWDKISKTGGADASIMYFLTDEDNLGLEESIAPKFMANRNITMTKADMIVLGGQISVTHCGGPEMQFRPGRIDAKPPKITSPKGRIPTPEQKLDVIKNRMYSMGFDDADIVALITGSHTLGGVHSFNSPKVTNESFIPFDDTPGIFDNHVFKFALKGQCALKIDCDIASDPALRPIVQKFANSQQEFFKQYQISFPKMNDLTISKLHEPQKLDIPSHDGLYDVVQPPTKFSTLQSNNGIQLSLEILQYLVGLQFLFLL
ncbi:heme peroxidase [Globomyces pollinis-pini]|nr:heme peroxidase [Globomyces pollinis-pini]